MEIIKKRQIIHVSSYQLYYERNDLPGAGYSFDCDKSGKLAPLTATQQESYDQCVNGTLDFTLKGVIDCSHDYTENAIGRCSCGRQMEIDNVYANKCECGLYYNCFGQQLAPRNQWREW